MRVLVVVNSSASAVTPRVQVLVAKALAVDHDVVVSETEGHGHATALAAEAARVGYDVVVALGGDGTVNQAANGLAGTGTALAVLPGGSTNVFARYLGAARDPIDAVGEVAAALRTAVPARIGLGWVESDGGPRRHFLVNLGVGFDATVIDRVERRALLKRYAGHPVFVAAAFDTWFRQRSSPAFRVLVGDDPAGVDARFAVVLNADPYSYLGRRPLHLSPGTDPDTGLGVVAFRSLGAAALLGAVGRALGSGAAVARSRALATWRRVDRAMVATFDGPVAHQVDGDYLGMATDMRIGHSPACLLLVRPSPAPAADRRGRSLLTVRPGRRGRRRDGS